MCPKSLARTRDFATIKSKKSLKAHVYTWHQHNVSQCFEICKWTDIKSMKIYCKLLSPFNVLHFFFASLNFHEALDRFLEQLHCFIMGYKRIFKLLSHVIHYIAIFMLPFRACYCSTTLRFLLQLKLPYLG